MTPVAEQIIFVLSTDILYAIANLMISSLWPKKKRWLWSLVLYTTPTPATK